MEQNIIFIKQEPHQQDSVDLYCRICLKNSIISGCKAATTLVNSAQTIADIIKEFAQVQILETDGYSQLVCLSCVGKLTVAIEIKTQILESDAKLKSQYPKTTETCPSYDVVNDDIKIEESDLDVSVKQREPEILDHYDYEKKLVQDIHETDDEDMECTALSLRQVDNSILENLPQKTANRYGQQYEAFMSWCENNNKDNYTEEVFLNYFSEKARTISAASLWTLYFMLKSTIGIKHDIDISKFRKLYAFIKEQNIGYKPNKLHIRGFTREDIKRFLIEAPDKSCLMWKVCLIFGVAGGCCRENLRNMFIDDIEDKGNKLIITIPDAKTRRKKTFIVTNKNCEDINPLNIYRKYRSLRPASTPHKSFFIFYRLGKCSTQPVGVHTFGKIPSLIANYLKLPDAKSYTGHAFKRTSASLLANTGSTCTNTLI